MDYFEGLGLNREPFSNSPDPDLFYRSKNHMECLQQMEIAVRLRRGLNVVTGDVGTGKTTLCRQLIRVLGHEESIETFLMLDPYFKDPLDFLRSLNLLFGVPDDRIEGSYPRLKENLREFLRKRGVDNNRIITLIVDEGQKITGECLELLRELLNFETNAFKLLQIVIFAQKEFNVMLKDRPNLADRVNFHFFLEPLDHAETKRMIETRLGLCSKDARAPELFTGAALWSIYRRSGGFPRKIVQLCHKALLLMAASGKKQAGFFTVARASRGIGPSPWTLKRGLVWAGALLWLIIPAWIIIGGFTPQIKRTFNDVVNGRLFHAAALQQEHVPAAVAVAESPSPAQPSTRLVDKPLGPLFEEAVPEEDATQRAARLAGLPVAKAPESPANPEADGNVAIDGKKQAGTAETLEFAPAGATPGEAVHVPAAVEVAAAGAAQPEPSPESAVKPIPQAPDATAASRKPDFSNAEIIEIVGAPVKTPETAATSAAGASPGEPAPAQEASGAALSAEELAGVKAADAAASESAVSGENAGSRPDGRTSLTAAPPGFLGDVAMQKGWVISLRAAKVYGSGGKRILSMFSGANPEIEDLDAVRPGQVLHFPAIIAGAPPAGSSLVRVGRADSLDMAFAYLSQARADWPELTLFAHFSPTQGLIFDVVMDKIFADRASAGRAAASLPQELAGKAVIVDSFEPGSVFYTDLGQPETAPLMPRSEEKAVAHNDSVKS